MHRFKSRKKALSSFAALAVVAVAAVAIAFWTGSGSGEGEGDVGTSGAVTLTGTVAPGISPGTNEAVSFTAANPSDSPVYVTSVHLVSVAADAEHAACETDDFSMVNVTQNHQVPAGATVEALPNNGSLVYANTGVNQDACKGATLTLTLTSN